MFYNILQQPETNITLRLVAAVLFFLKSVGFAYFLTINRKWSWKGYTDADFAIFGLFVHTIALTVHQAANTLWWVYLEIWKADAAHFRPLYDFVIVGAYAGIFIGAPLLMAPIIRSRVGTMWLVFSWWAITVTYIIAYAFVDKVVMP